MHLEHEVLVFVVNPRVGDHDPYEFADGPLRIGVNGADPQGGIGVVIVQVERHRSGSLLGEGASCRRGTHPTYRPTKASVSILEQSGTRQGPRRRRAMF